MLPPTASLQGNSTVKEGFNEFYFSLLLQRGLEMPDDVSQREDTKSRGNLQDFIDVVQEAKSGQTSLLSLVHQLHEDKGNRVAQVIQPHAAGMPGFSNNPLVQPEPCKEVRAIMAWKDVVAAMVTKEQAKNTSHMRYIFNEEVPQNVVASCEDQLINGNGAGITGLFNVGDALSVASDDDLSEDEGRNQTRETFYYHALRMYISRARRRPTHIILPDTEIIQLLPQGQKVLNTARVFPNKFLGMTVIGSKAVPEGRGLMVAADEIVLASSPGLKWEFGHSNDELESQDLSAIILKCKMGLLIKRPETIARLSLNNEHFPSLPGSNPIFRRRHCKPRYRQTRPFRKRISPNARKPLEHLADTSPDNSL